MGFFSGHISPIEYLQESSDKTREIGDLKRALTWIGIISAFITIISVVVGAFIGSGNAVMFGLSGLAIAFSWSVMAVVGSAFIALSIRLLGGDTTWGNYFCTSLVSGCLLIIPGLTTGFLAGVFGPESAIGIILNLIYLVFAITYTVSSISASGSISIGRSILAWIVAVVMLSVIFFGITMIFGTMISGLAASSGIMPY